MLQPNIVQVIIKVSARLFFEGAREIFRADMQSVGNAGQRNIVHIVLFHKGSRLGNPV